MVTNNQEWHRSSRSSNSNQQQLLLILVDEVKLHRCLGFKWQNWYGCVHQWSRQWGGRIFVSKLHIKHLLLESTPWSFLHNSSPWTKLTPYEFIWSKHANVNPSWKSEHVRGMLRAGLSIRQRTSIPHNLLMVSEKDLTESQEVLC